MNRFFVLPEQVLDDRIFFTPEESFRIRNVLRLKQGDPVAVLDNSGMEWNVELTALAKQGVIGTIRRKTRHQIRRRPEIALAIAPPSHQRMDWIVQKSTELGVDKILPFVCRRALRKSPGKNRTHRWRRIAKEAAEQSRRVYIPVVGEIVSFPDIPERGNNDLLKVILWENEKEFSLRSILEKKLPQSDDLLIVVGPEGGFEDEEIESARRLGFVSACLGGGILRVETAALAAISIIQYCLGRIG